MHKILVVCKKIIAISLVAAVIAATSFMLTCEVQASYVRPVNICFLGNSYMSAGNLKSKFTAICREQGIRVSIVMYAWESAYLCDHADNAEVLKDLRNGEYDMVVLQEESRTVWQDTASSKKYAKILADAAKAGGAGVYLYQTMSYRDDGPEEQVYYTNAYNEIAKYIGGTVCPCGERFWAYKAENDLTLDDMFSDWQHPSDLGFQVVAQTMYDTMAAEIMSKASFFYDVPSTHNYQSAVYWAVDQGIAAGYSGEKYGYFGIGDKITRGQVVMFLWRAAGKPDPVKNTRTFSDVPVTHNYYKAIQWAVENGITGGYTGKNAGKFGPADNCTRGQIAMFLWRYSGKPEPAATSQDATDAMARFVPDAAFQSASGTVLQSGSGTSVDGRTFSDVPVSHSFYKAIQWAYEQGITAGYKDGSFGVNRTCTRGQCVTFLYRMLGR